MSENNGSQQVKKERADLAVLGAMPMLGGLVPRSLEEAMNLSKILAESLLLPAHLRGKPADVLVTMMKGMELGLKPMHAFAEIFVVEGKPGCSAALKRALILTSPSCEYARFTESTDKRATYVSKRIGGVETKTTYTIEQAATAGLTGKSVWKNHPAAMLRARASSGEADANWPERVQGMSSLDELKEIEGRVVDVKPNGPPLGATVAPPAPKPTPPSAVPDEPVAEDDFDFSVPKPEEKPTQSEAVKAAGGITNSDMDRAGPPPVEEAKPTGPSDLEKVVILIGEAASGEQLEKLREAVLALPKTDQFVAKKAYSDKRAKLAGAKAS